MQFDTHAGGDVYVVGVCVCTRTHTISYVKRRVHLCRSIVSNVMNIFPLLLRSPHDVISRTLAGLVSDMWRKDVSVYEPEPCDRVHQVNNNM